MFFIRLIQRGVLRIWIGEGRFDADYGYIDGDFLNWTEKKIMTLLRAGFTFSILILLAVSSSVFISEGMFLTHNLLFLRLVL